MIVLLWEAAAPKPDNLLIATTAVSAIQPVSWYCSWINSSSPEIPFRNNIDAMAPGTAIMNIPSPIQTPSIIQEVREVTVFNPGPDPVQVQIQFENGNTGLISTLVNSMLPGGSTLSYNATPGENGVWQRFDYTGFLVSSR
jgi:hypothetical protein